ncbi:MAG TPA: hypothetical protein VJB11_02300 [archaeon]|nr:hypothetical protein [archaeon]
MQCPYCHNQNVVRRGLRKNLKKSKQLFLCNSCKRKFTPDFPRMRFSKRVVGKAMKLRRSGLSSPKIKTMLQQQGVKVSCRTILKWEKKFVK